MYISRANFSDMEIEVFFAKYDKNGDGTTLDNADDIFDDIDNDDIDDLNNSDMEDAMDGQEQGGVSCGPKTVTYDDLLKYAYE